MSRRRWHSIPLFPLKLFIHTVLPLTILLLFITLGSLAQQQRAMRKMVGVRDAPATRAAGAAISEQINHRRSAVGAFAPASLARRALADFLGGNVQATAYLVTLGGDS